MKKWKPLFQMLANLVVSFTSAALLLFLVAIVLKPRVWAQVRFFLFPVVFGLIFRLIENYHKKKNAQTRT